MFKDKALLMFICMQSGQKPVFVSYYGSRVDGIWTCTKDRTGVCVHTQTAKKNPVYIDYRAEVTGENPDEADEGNGEDDAVEGEMLQAAAERERGKRRATGWE